MKLGRLGFTLKLKRIKIYDVPYADRWISILLLTLSEAAILVNQLKQLISYRLEQLSSTRNSQNKNINLLKNLHYKISFKQRSAKL